MIIISIGEEQYSQPQEKGIDEDKQCGGDRHVFLGFPCVPAGEVLLHHILIKPCHGDGQADA